MGRSKVGGSIAFIIFYGILIVSNIGELRMVSGYTALLFRFVRKRCRARCILTNGVHSSFVFNSYC